MRRRTLPLLLLLALALAGCKPVLTSRVPVLPTGEEVPAGAMPRDLPTGTGDTLTVMEEKMRVGVRYVVSAPGGRVGSIAFLPMPGVPLSAIQVPGGEARALYLAQGRVTQTGLERLLHGTRHAKDLARTLTDDGGNAEERYLFGFFALMRQGTDAPRLALVQCGPSHAGQEPIAAALRAQAARQGLKLDADGDLARLPNRDLALSVLAAALRDAVAKGDCRADLPLQLPDL
ncbi:hypothetical protein [Niveispirillum sp.]|uniref:hypothetical protein n=1 Tax=Niveispirillum sp. TaxID=1917217 RepID=UPI001B6DDC7B|nr:hypothetical protein [Niveispirillum sp.]MBP7334533.1 hypothetical protein [Niveispirillum sp.]